MKKSFFNGLPLLSLAVIQLLYQLLALPKRPTGLRIGDKGKDIPPTTITWNIKSSNIYR